MRNIRLVIEYDGSKYHGWQFQSNAHSVQQELAMAIKKLTGESVIPDGAGRTDAGVHALGQVASFMTKSSIPPKGLPCPQQYIIFQVSLYCVQSRWIGL